MTPDLIFGNKVKGRSADHKDDEQSSTPDSGHLGLDVGNSTVGDGGGRLGFNGERWRQKCRWRRKSEVD